MLRLGHRVSIIAPKVAMAEDACVFGERVFGLGPPRSGLTTRLRRRLPPSVPGALIESEMFGARLRDAVHRVDRIDPIDLIEVEESFGLPSRLRRADVAPVVARLHGPWQAAVTAQDTVVTASDEARIRAEKAGILEADGVTAPTAATLAPYRSLNERCAQIFNPIPAADVLASSRNEPGLIVFVGRIDRRKGADVAIRAAVAAMGERSDARMILCGADDGIEFGSERLRFDEYVSRFVDYRFHDRLSFLGVRSPVEIAELRSRASVVLVPSRYETFCYTVGEAMAEGCAVVAASCNGVTELIEDGRTGLLVPPGDFQATASAILQAMTDDSLSRRLRREARGWVQDKLDPDLLARETEAFYERVLAKPSPERMTTGGR